MLAVMESVKIKNLFLLERSMHSRASSMVRPSAMKMKLILNAMTVAMIDEDCCYRDPLGVFRTVSVEWCVAWKSISVKGQLHRMHSGVSFE